jgi:hypothetical protein
MEENFYAPPTAVVADAASIKNDVEVRFHCPRELWLSAGLPLRWRGGCPSRIS